MLRRSQLSHPSRINWLDSHSSARPGHRSGRCDHCSADGESVRPVEPDMRQVHRVVRVEPPLQQVHDPHMLAMLEVQDGRHRPRCGEAIPQHVMGVHNVDVVTHPDRLVTGGCEVGVQGIRGTEQAVWERGEVECPFPVEETNECAGRRPARSAGPAGPLRQSSCQLKLGRSGLLDFYRGENCRSIAIRARIADGKRQP